MPEQADQKVPIDSKGSQCIKGTAQRDRQTIDNIHLQKSF